MSKLIIGYLTEEVSQRYGVLLSVTQWGMVITYSCNTGHGDE
ncbi:MULTISPECIES: hypothetical protein [Bacteroides]|nr:hypothetical protein [Bacteroides ovatus]MCS2966844.1 hypothetical protein [Bacteroides ovatus]